jgi:hypothetical protein
MVKRGEREIRGMGTKLYLIWAYALIIIKKMYLIF